MTIDTPTESDDEVTFRPVSSTDLEAVLELNQAALPAVNSVPIKFFDQHSKSGRAVFRVAVVEPNTCVGFLLALRPGEAYDSLNYRWFNNHFDSFLYVDRIVIAPEAQGRGLGKQFYSDLETLGRSEDPPAERICCEVNIRPRNERSLRFHQRFGFNRCFEQEVEGGKKVVRLLTYEF